MQYGPCATYFRFLAFLGLFSDAGDVFTCGDGSFGQLGHGDYSLHCSPVKVSFFDDHCVEQIACGMRHSLVLLKGNCKAGNLVLYIFRQTQCYNVDMLFYLDVCAL